jgi:hypothetical protein
MISDRAKIRALPVCLIITVVLFLGLVQWSFLPLLLDGGLPSSSAVVGISSGHTSKFAAPYKCLFADPLDACLLPSGVSAPMPTVGWHRPLDEPVYNRIDRFFSHRQLRAPPSV